MKKNPDENKLNKSGNSSNDNLIFTNAHTYRLHSDKLRWTLFGGYLIIFGAVIKEITGSLSLIMWSFSMLYLFIVAVQHWFYNLFAGYASDCDSRLLNNEDLRSLNEYSNVYGKYVKLNHPAYTFALLIISLCSSYFFTNGINYLIRDINLLPFVVTLNYRYFISGILHIVIIIFLSNNWNRYVFKAIKKWANLWGGNYNFTDKVELKGESYSKLKEEYKILYNFQEKKNLYCLKNMNKAEQKLFKKYIKEV
jgi:hypothetical protein